MVKDAPNRVQMKRIGLAHTLRKILEGSDVLIFLVVLSTPDPHQLSLHNHCDCTGIMVCTSRLIQYLYDRKFSAGVQHSHSCLEVYEHHTVIICILLQPF